MGASRLLSAVLAAVISSSTPSARLSQNQKNADRDQIKLKAELVQIDVLVTDRDGKAVNGLSRDDFELLDNNKPQPITHFSYEKSNPSAPEDSSADRPIPKATTAAELKRVIAFVVDTLHMQFENLYRTRKMLREFVDNQIRPGDLVLILPTGGGSGLLQQFTSDRSLLRSAIDRLRLVNVNNGVVSYRNITSDLPFSSPGQPTDWRNRGNGRLSMPDTPGSHTADPLEDADARVTLQTLNNLITSMRQLPGRKLSVFVSEGFRLFPTQTSPELNETIGLAARANVVFYSIDPKGLVAPSNASDDMGLIEEKGPVAQQIARIFQQQRIEVQNARESLGVLALETGGKLFSNNNDINKGLANLLTENAAYYLLGFQPEPSQWDGRLHKIKVVVPNRPELKVNSRKSYLARSDPPRPSNADLKVQEAIDAISSPLVRRDIDLRLTTLYLDNEKREPVVTLLLHINASKLHFIESEGRFGTSLEQIGFVLAANGQPVESFSNTLELDLQQKTRQTALKRGFVTTRTTNLRPGIYQVRLFVREIGSGLIGTANDLIEIPDLKATDRLSASSLFLTGQASHQNTQANAGPASPSQRRFPANGDFSYSIVIFNPKVHPESKQPQLEMRTRISSGSKVVFAGQLRPVLAGEGSAPPYRFVTGGVIKPLALAPGDYTVEVIVWDKLRKKDSIIRRETDFTVD